MHNIEWITNGNQSTAQYYDCSIRLLRDRESGHWVALITMPERYILRLPAMPSENAKKAAIDAIETIGKAYSEFVAELSRGQDNARSTQ